MIITKSTSKTGELLTKYSLDAQDSDFEDVREELEESSQDLMLLHLLFLSNTS